MKRMVIGVFLVVFGLISALHGGYGVAHATPASKAQQLVDSVMPMIKDWATEHGATMPAFVYDDSDPWIAYWPDRRAVVYGDSSFEYGWSRENKIIGTLYAVSHEFAHHLQGTRNIYGPPAEQQANCVAGAIQTWAYKKRYISENPKKVVQLIVDMLNSMPSREHGPVELTTGAYLLGVSAGIDTCLVWGALDYRH